MPEWCRNYVEIMLTHLHIQNYALISHLDLDLASGFSVLTGETGAGKSIILGALNLVMGARADTKAITQGEERCVIEATFDTEDKGELLIRRELNQSGRSRSFVNDEVVTQAELKALANKLIDIHSQHESLLIGDDLFQIGVVDAIAGNTKQRETYSVCYQAYMQAQKALHDLQELARKTQADADYVAFQYNQLEEAHLVADEMGELQDEEYRLSHAEEIKAALLNALNNIDGEQGGALSLLRDSRVENASSDLAQRLDSVEIELHDIANEIQRIVNRTEIDPQRLAEVQERLDLLQTLMNKHRVQSVEELIALRDRLGEQMQRMASFDEEIAERKADLTRAEKAMEEAAKALTDSRIAVCETIASHLIDDMHKLGVVHANVAVSVSPLAEYNETGHDDVQFLFAANLNQSLRRVAEVASGGEISRLMLCIKSLIASTNGLPTIIFDEIDTGVSGEIASQMGDIMRQMSASRQIIAITHLPQIAAKGDTQYRVYKADTETRTETHIKRLTPEERVQDIAAMLSGKNPTAEALAIARQLLGAPKA